MSQTSRLLQALKSELRRQGRTYADAAGALGLSEASVKRLFSRQGFSLKRLDRLCSWLGLEFSDLVRLMEEQEGRLVALNPAQEQELVSDLRLLLVTLCLFNNWQPDEIVETYRIRRTECIGLLGRLDRMGVIELLPGDRVRLRIDRDFGWLKGGPIQRFFESQVQHDFFACHFDQPGECRLVINGMLSDRANAEIQRRMQRLAADFNDLHESEQRIPRERRFGTTLVLALRPWEADVFERLRRTPDPRRFPG